MKILLSILRILDHLTDSFPIVAIIVLELLQIQNVNSTSEVCHTLIVFRIPWMTVYSIHAIFHYPLFLLPKKLVAFTPIFIIIPLVPIPNIALYIPKPLTTLINHNLVSSR